MAYKRFIDTKVLITCHLVPKTQYNSNNQNLEKKIEDVHENISNTNNLVSKVLLIQELLRLKK